jgi:hypothetical protein
MKMSGQFHISVALYLGKQSNYPLDWRLGVAPRRSHYWLQPKRNCSVIQHVACSLQRTDNIFIKFQSRNKEYNSKEFLTLIRIRFVAILLCCRGRVWLPSWARWGSRIAFWALQCVKHYRNSSWLGLVPLFQETTAPLSEVSKLKH